MKSKILVTAISLVLSGAAMAADPTAPVAPVIPNLITTSQTATAALTESTTNRVLIDQSGNNPTVNIIQAGSGNAVGSDPSNPVYLRGADQKVVIIQSGVGSASGNNNLVDLQLVNAAGGENVGASVTIRQLGNSNVVNAICGDGDTGCNNADINWRFTGNGNNVYFRAKGDNLTSQTDISGNNNNVNSLMLGNNHTQIVDAVGNYNEFNLSQTSFGGAGSSILVDQNGDSTVYNVNQTGTVDSVLNVKSVANGGSFNISQHN